MTTPRDATVVSEPAAEAAVREELRRAVDSLARLQALTAALAAVKTVEEIGAVVVGTASQAVNAPAGVLFVVDRHGTSIEAVRHSGYDPATAARFPGPFPLDAPVPVAAVVRGGEPLFLESLEQVQARFPAIAGPDGARGALTCLPLHGEDGVIGALGFSFHRARRFAPDERALLIAIAGQAALALARARTLDALVASVRAREELLAMVSHDLRNPLGVILLRAGLLLAQLPEGSQVHRHADQIHGAGQRMDKLVRDLLDLASIEAGRLQVDPQAEDVAALLAEVDDAHRPLAAARDLVLAVEAPPPGVVASCDRERVIQVFSNLIGNAIKHTPAGGTIRVTARPDDARVWFDVADTGAGMTPEQLAHVFRPYWQAESRDRRGLGLGLSIARGLVEAHGGEITVSSTPGAGSTFSFSLPSVRR